MSFSIAVSANCWLKKSTHNKWGVWNKDILLRIGKKTQPRGILAEFVIYLFLPPSDCMKSQCAFYLTSKNYYKALLFNTMKNCSNEMYVIDQNFDALWVYIMLISTLCLDVLYWASNVGTNMSTGSQKKKKKNMKNNKKTSFLVALVYPLGTMRSCLRNMRLPERLQSKLGE